MLLTGTGNVFDDVALEVAEVVFVDKIPNLCLALFVVLRVVLSHSSGESHRQQ